MARKRIPATYKECGSAFMARADQVRIGQGKYCSRRCSARTKAKLHNQAGSNNPNWKGGVSADATRYTASYKKDNPQKIAAHNAVATALRNGTLVRQPCEQCGEKRTDAHHDDYSKPLDVKWLCRKHHIQYHREHG